MEIEMETSQPIDNSVGTIKILLRPNPFRTSIFGRLQSIPPPPPLLARFGYTIQAGGHAV